MLVKILDFKEEYSKYFYELNIEWLKKYFYVEEHDNEVLSNPKKFIIDTGGIVLFAQYNDEIVGTVALMYLKDENCFELTKMAVSPDYRGNKIGQIILENCIKKAKKMGLNKVILYSNRVLENAIHIYKKNGFVEIPVESGSPYKRADIKMELKL
jgi:N-acetylglutamate synthase-like GNAT family acetyltransferase